MQEFNKNELKSFIDITVHSRIILGTLQLKENGIFIVLLCTISWKNVIQRNPITWSSIWKKTPIYTIKKKNLVSPTQPQCASIMRQALKTHGIFKNSIMAFLPHHSSALTTGRGCWSEKKESGKRQNLKIKMYLYLKSAI